MPAAKKSAGRRKAAAPQPATCPDCKGNGEITESVRVGARKGHVTADQQSALCLTCLGTGTYPDPAV